MSGFCPVLLTTCIVKKLTTCIVTNLLTSLSKVHHLRSPDSLRQMGLESGGGRRPVLGASKDRGGCAPPPPSRQQGKNGPSGPRDCM
jgi:hypothetical protein